MREKEGLLLIGSFDARFLIFLKCKLWVLLELSLKTRLLLKVVNSVMDLVLLDRLTEARLSQFLETIILSMKAFKSGMDLVLLAVFVYL